MLADERRSQIANMVKQEHAVTTSELVERFQVSLETIRRDLEGMEQQGLLRRVHGGAVPVGGPQDYHNFATRSRIRQPEKHKLALMACACIGEGDYIAIDCGTTAIELAKCIRGRFRKLTVLTYSLEVFHILSEDENCRVILAGGHYLAGEKSFCGHLTVDMMRQVHVAKSFLTPSGIALGYGISDYVQEIIELQRTMLEIADEVCILADSAKYGVHAPLKICGVDTGYRYFTDPGLPEEICETYGRASIHINK